MSGDSGLLTKAVRAAGWGYAGTAIKLVMQLGVQILLARILGPAEYGLFAIGVIVVAFALYFGDVASSALIPLEAVSSEQTRFAFTWQLMVSAAVTTIIFLLAGPIAGFVNEPGAERVLQSLSFVCVLNAFGGVGLAILRRRLDYRMIQVAQLAGYFVGYVLVALPWAVWWEPSVNSLVAAWLVQVLVTSIIFFLVAPHSVVPKLACKDGKQLLLFGWHSLLSNLGTWAQSNLDRIVVARSFPVAQVGLYTTSANLLSTPLSQIYATFQSVIFSASARLEDESERGKDVFVTLLLLGTFIVGLMYGFTFAVADELIDILYGEKWSGAAPFIQVFSVVLFFNALSGIVSPLLWASGAIKQDAKIQVTMAVLLAVSSLVASQQSALVVGWAVAFCSAIRGFTLIKIGLRHFKQAGAAFISEFFRISLGLLATIFLAWAFANYLVAIGLSCSGIVSVVAIWFLIGMLLMLRVRKWFGSAFNNGVDLVLNKIPKGVRRLVPV